MSDPTATPEIAAPAEPAPAPVAEPAAPATPAVADAAPAAAPVPFAFKPIEGMTLEADVVDAYTQAVADSGMAPEAAQKLMEKMAPVMQASQAKAVEAMGSEWEKQTMADPEIGGAKVSENLSIAKKALDTFATPQLKALLDSSKLGNHPEVVRLFLQLGKKISSDKFIPGGTAAVTPTRTAAQILYPSQS